MVDMWAGLVANHPIVSLEDPMDEEDWDGFAALTAKVGDKVQIVGDDLFVTNASRLARGITEGSANAILVKVNQIGTLSETLQAVDMAQKAGFGVVISHRSGETEDSSSPIWQSPQMPARSRQDRFRALTGWRNTTSCCASTRSWTSGLFAGRQVLRG